MFLEHVNLTVSSVDESIDFYRHLFDFEVRWRGTNSSGRPAAHVGNQRHYLALFEAPRSGHADESYDRVGLNHLGFVVEDLEVQRQRLDQLDIKPHLEADYEPGRRLYFRDPDGIEVELVEYPKSAAKLKLGDVRFPDAGWA